MNAAESSAATAAVSAMNTANAGLSSSHDPISMFGKILVCVAMVALISVLVHLWPKERK